MNSNRYKYFRWTPRTARITFTWVVVVPALVGYAAYKTDVSRSPRPGVSELADTKRNTGPLGFPGEEERRPDRGAVDGGNGWSASLCSLYISRKENRNGRLCNQFHCFRDIGNAARLGTDWLRSSEDIKTPSGAETQTTS